MTHIKPSDIESHARKHGEAAKACYELGYQLIQRGHDHLAIWTKAAREINKRAGGES